MTLDNPQTDPDEPRVRPQPFWRRFQQGNLFLGDAGALFISTVATGFLGLVFWVLAGRLYPASNVGLASAVFSAMFLIGNISRLGLDISLVLHVSKGDPPSRYLGMASASLLVVTATGALLALIFILQPIVSPQTRNYLFNNLTLSLLFVVSCALWGMGLVLDQVLLVRKRRKEVIAKNVSFAVVRVCVVPLLVLVGWHHTGLIVGTAVSIAASLLLVWVRTRRLVTLGWPQIRGGFTTLTSSLVGTSLWNYLSSLIAGLPTWFLPLLIVEQLSAEAGARFYTSWMISTMINLGPAAIAGGLLTAGARHGQSSGGLLRNAYVIALIYVVPISAATIWLAPVILHIFGREYAANSIGILRLLTAASIPYAITQINFTQLRLANRPILLTGLAAVFSIGVLVGAALAMPAFGINGVGIAWIGSCIAIGIVSSIAVGVDSLERR